MPLDTAAYRRAADVIRSYRGGDCNSTEAARLIDELCTELDNCRETLRDRFAMAALTGLLANDAERYHEDVSTCAPDAYIFADAMMQERTPEVPRQDAADEGAGDRH